MNLGVFLPTRTKLLATLLAALLCTSSIGLVAHARASTDVAAVAKKKKKKCKKSQERLNGKCIRKRFQIKPTKLVITVAKLHKGQFGATGYAEFPMTTRQSVLKGYWEVSNGVGYERRRVEWTISKGLNTEGFTTDGTDTIGLTGKNMTVTLVVRGVRSNAQPLIG